MGATEIEATLSYAAVERNVAASRQNQAFSALLFLYENVLQKDLERPGDAFRATRPKCLPTALSREEAQQVLAAMCGTYQLIAKLLYGSGCSPTRRWVRPPLSALSCSVSPIWRTSPASLPTKPSATASRAIGPIAWLPASDV